MTPDEIVAGLRDGMTIGIGGWGLRRKPMALVRAILRAPLRNLTIRAGLGSGVIGVRAGPAAAASRVRSAHGVDDEGLRHRRMSLPGC